MPMNPSLLNALSVITEEELKILDGNTSIDQTIYSDDKELVVDCKKLLNSGKLIQVRPHTRFIHFPKHKHNYIEMIYMCSGSTTHIVNGATITLNCGELLILSQNAIQEILPASKEDVAINFIILPEFFDQSLNMMGTEKSLIRDFIVGCLKSSDSSLPFLHFKVSSVLPIQNLVENLAWTIVNNIQNKRLMNQITMGLLFLQLMNHTDKIEAGKNAYEQEMLIIVLQYIEEHYKDGELTVLANQMGCELTWLSKLIKKVAGSTYTELVQQKRLNKACYLLKTTQLSIIDISLAVGYDNFSYFHRLFKQTYGVSPRTYRITT